MSHGPSAISEHLAALPIQQISVHVAVVVTGPMSFSSAIGRIVRSILNIKQQQKDELYNLLSPTLSRHIFCQYVVKVFDHRWNISIPGVARCQLDASSV